MFLVLVILSTLLSYLPPRLTLTISLFPFPSSYHFHPNTPDSELVKNMPFTINNY